MFNNNIEMSETASAAVPADMESRIIEVAKTIFIEKGFVGTNMSDIAAAAGINRPTLHYYFRTKDRMFQAVFGMIIQQILPHLHEVVLNREMSVAGRLGILVDTYFEVFMKTPSLPLFMAREIQRDAGYILEVISRLAEKRLFTSLVDGLCQEMAEGKINNVPLHVIFYSFYGAVTFPFISRKLAGALLVEGDETFESMIETWKPYIVRQMTNLLAPDKTSDNQALCNTLS